MRLRYNKGSVNRLLLKTKVVYIVQIDDHASFSVPFTPANSNKDYGMRILGFYDPGLSRNNYYDSYDKIMPFDGNKKTFTSRYGVELTFYFRGY